MKLLALLAIGGLMIAATPTRADHPAPSAPVRATVDWIIDGDTVMVRLGDGRREKLRLRGVDTPEMKGRCPAERKAARAARDFLIARLKGRAVVLDRTGRDNYDRLLARLRLEGSDMAETLIARGLGRPYRGGWRPGWCNR